MKKFGIVIVACVLCLTSMVSLAKAEVVVSGDVYAGVYNKYLFRGIDLSDQSMVTQFGADLSYKGLTLSYWSNMLTHDGTILGTDYKAADVSETDITLNYSFTPIELLTFNVGNTYYTLDSVPDTNELYLKATLNTLLSPTLAMYWDWDQSKETGLFYTLSVGHTFNLVKNLDLNLGALISYNQQNYSASEAYSNWHNFELSAGLDYTFLDNFKVSASYTYSNAMSSRASHDGGLREQNLYGVKAAFNF